MKTREYVKGGNMHFRLVRPIVLLMCVVISPKLSAQCTPECSPSGLAEPYKIQANDVLEIFVWKEPDLTRKVLVRPDGRISFPLIQDLSAAGISPPELKDEIEKRLKEYIDAPN